MLGLCLATALFGASQSKGGQESQLPKAEAGTGAATYRIDDLGEFVQVAADVTVSLNSDGVVAYWTKVNGRVCGTIWRDSRAQPILSVAGYPSSIAHAINNQGDVGGWMSTSENLVDSLSATRGFILHAKRITLTPGLGGRDTRILGMNDMGRAVGSSMLASGVKHAMLVLHTVSSDLGTLPSGTSSTAYAINSAGVIAGVADIHGQANHAVLWKHRRIMDLGVLPHGTTSGARAINELGQIVGFSDTPDGVHAFLYANGVMKDLGTLGNDPSEASSINDRGDVVGASNVTSTQRHAFLWRNGRMRDLNASLPEGSTWVLLKAFGINDRGQIVCSARHKGEPLHLLLLTPN